MVCFLRLNVGGAYCLLCLSAAVLLTCCPLSLGLVSKYSCGESEFVQPLNYVPPHKEML